VIDGIGISLEGNSAPSPSIFGSVYDSVGRWHRV
jgi:hypothetical protein